MTQPDRLRYLPGRSRNRAHLLPAWQDGEFRTSRCGITAHVDQWFGRFTDAEIITAHKRPLCRNCAGVYRINEGQAYVPPFYPEGTRRQETAVDHA